MCCSVRAGIYYPQGSLKARLCVAGRTRLYQYCEARGVPHKRTGKILVAADASQLEDLRSYQRKGRANGVRRSTSPCNVFASRCLVSGVRQACARPFVQQIAVSSAIQARGAVALRACVQVHDGGQCMHASLLQVDLKWLEGHEAKALEPELRCVAALWSENTGIVDSHQCAARALSCPLRALRLLAAGCWLLAAGCWLLAAGCWLLAAGCWLLAAGCTLAGLTTVGAACLPHALHTGLSRWLSK
jgi:L-2-hydroxyglutarate oxidase LhgO